MAALLPEVVEIVCRNAMDGGGGAAALYPCLLVSKTFYEAAAPMIWEAPVDFSPFHRALENALNEVTQNKGKGDVWRLQRNRRYLSSIRKLRLGGITEEKPQMLESLIPHLTGLQHLLELSERNVIASPGFLKGLVSSGVAKNLVTATIATGSLKGSPQLFDALANAQSRALRHVVSLQIEFPLALTENTPRALVDSVGDSLSSFLPTLEGLSSLFIDGLPINDKVISTIGNTTFTQKLHKLTLYRGTHTTVEPLSGLKNLQHLDIIGSPALQLGSPRTPSPEELTEQDYSMPSATPTQPLAVNFELVDVIQACGKNLQSLSLYSMHGLNDRVLNILATEASQSLRELRLVDNKARFSATAWNRLIHHCRGLRVLNVMEENRRFYSVTDVSDLHMLEELYLENVGFEPDSVRSLVRGCPRLRNLTLWVDMADGVVEQVLEDVGERGCLPQLEILRLVDPPDSWREYLKKKKPKISF
ncbi:hypothetical protein HDU76_001158 [Blyttiomyces sp. JEL0837]|nr:hypothetical protein HDU76_001158 [Blyttiomyces sp. JEL0837]